MHLNKQLSEEKARGSCKHFSPHFHLSHPSMYWPALAHWGGPLAAQQRHVTLEGLGLRHSASPNHTMHTSSAELRQLFDPSSSTSQFLVCPLPERKDGACVSWGGRCYISDLPLHAIGFGDIRIERSVALPLPPPIAKLAIMPSVSKHFSIKIQTASSLSSLLLLSPSPNIPHSLALSLFPISPPPRAGGRIQPDDLELPLPFKFPSTRTEATDRSEKRNSQNGR